jgi:hypothetical protein
VFDLRKLHPRHWWNPRLIWDLFMVWVALINLGLILFDLTYLLLRPTYVEYLPVITRTYDPVKGIEPHPLTEELLAEADRTLRLVRLDPDAPALKARTERLERLTIQVLRENPFQRSNQERTLEVLKALIAREVGTTTLDIETSDSMVASVDEFWAHDGELLDRHLEQFEAAVSPLLRINYFREVTLKGRPVDHFWMIDLPFLLLFIVEFATRWLISVRGREHRRWFFFPIFNWYDLLGLIPYTQFRVFRLFRIASIYMRLRRSELSRVGKDVVSRLVAYVSNIIAEEISDAVSLRILNETQAEIRDGTHKRIFDRTIVARRDRIEGMAEAQVRSLVLSEDVQARLRELVRLNIDRAALSSEAFRSVPLPNAVLRPLVRGVGEVVAEATLQSIVGTLQSEEGRGAVRELTRSILDQLLHGPLRDELDELAEEIGIDVIENMKQAVAVKKWAENG